MPVVEEGDFVCSPKLVAFAMRRAEAYMAVRSAPVRLPRCRRRSRPSGALRHALCRHAVEQYMEWPAQRSTSLPKRARRICSPVNSPQPRRARPVAGSARGWRRSGELVAHRLHRRGSGRVRRVIVIGARNWLGTPVGRGLRNEQARSGEDWPPRPRAGRRTIDVPGRDSQCNRCRGERLALLARRLPSRGLRLVCIGDHPWWWGRRLNCRRRSRFGGPGNERS